MGTINVFNLCLVILIEYTKLEIFSISAIVASSRSCFIFFYVPLMHCDSNFSVCVCVCLGYVCICVI